MFVVVVTENGVEVVKALMCIRLQGRKFVRADEVRVGEDKAFLVANRMEESFDDKTIPGDR